MNTEAETVASATEPVDRIFRRMAATYGSAWDRSLGQTPIADIKSAWMHELSGYMQSRTSMLAIAWALENLPEKSPNVIEFKRLCRLAPSADVPQLDAPKADPERIKAELAKLAPLRGQVAAAASANSFDPKGWARRIIARHEAGDKIAPCTLKMARQGLALK